MWYSVDFVLLVFYQPHIAIGASVEPMLEGGSA